MNAFIIFIFGLLLGYIVSLLWCKRKLKKLQADKQLGFTILATLLNKYKFSKDENLKTDVLIFGREYAILVDDENKLWKVKEVEKLTKDESNALIKIGVWVMEK